jgi:hypothetical protein
MADDVENSLPSDLHGAFGTVWKRTGALHGAPGRVNQRDDGLGQVAGGYGLESMTRCATLKPL